MTHPTTLNLGRIVHGYWRAHEWSLNTHDYIQFIEQLLALGIHTFDHAACYGGFTNEGAFGKALATQPHLREHMTIISKCGILFPNATLPNITQKYYDNSQAHIIWSAERSINELQCAYLDLLLLHRPSPYAHPEEIAAAFAYLHQRGLVRHFGVSNYPVHKLKMLQSYLDLPLVTNQIEISPLHLAPFDDGSLDYLLEKRIKPMAWSPLAGGKLFAQHNERSQRVAQALLQVGERWQETRLDTLAYAWLLSHPSGIIPIVGSGKIERIRHAIAALDKVFTEEEWIAVYSAAQGYLVP